MIAFSTSHPQTRYVKTYLQELSSKLRRECEAREAENDEIAAVVKGNHQRMEEKIVNERQSNREALEEECKEMEAKMEREREQRTAGEQDLASKLALLAQSAARHVDGLKHFVFKECQNLFDVATKPSSVVFNAYRYAFQHMHTCVHTACPPVFCPPLSREFPKSLP